MTNEYGSYTLWSSQSAPLPGLFWTFNFNANVTAADIRQGRSSTRGTQTGPVLCALSFSHFSMFSLELQPFSLRLFEPRGKASETSENKVKMQISSTEGLKPSEPSDAQV